MASVVEKGTVGKSLVESDALLTSDVDFTAPATPVRSRLARVAGVAGALLAAAVLASAFTGQARPHRALSPAADASQALVLESLPSYPDDDVLGEDPCKQRKRKLQASDTDAGDDEDDMEVWEEFTADWDPCQVSPEAAIKTEKMMSQAIAAEQAKKHSSKHGAKTSLTETTEGPSNRSAKRTGKKESRAKRAAADNCSMEGEDCSDTKCCSTPGMQCYVKVSGWSMCRASCTPGPDPSDVDSTPWNCTALGSRKPGEVPECHQQAENCMESKCCSEAGATCYRKNATFATCRRFCTPGPDYTDEDWTHWDCEPLGPAGPSKAEWVDEECSGDEDDCRGTMCCKTPGYQCFAKGQDWAQCKAECSTEQDPDQPWETPWTCKQIGSRTGWEKPLWQPGPEGGKVAPWVKERCAKTGVEDCSKSQCCLGVGMQCYKKAEGWAVCKEECQAGPDPSDNNESWSCDTLGSRSPGLALKGYPSLFCFAVLRTEGYELPLVRAQWEVRSGIFNCDGFVVFSDKVIEIADTESLKTPEIAVGISKDGTAGNTELFMAIWDMLFEDGRVWLHDWTIKADPDAVLLPDRLRNHLAPHTGWGEHDGKLYVVNCNAWPSSPSFPMLYGAVEVFSMKAMKAYARHVEKCKDELPWSDWGEDFFLTRCMDQIDVGRLLDFTLVGDDLCVGPGQGGAGDCASAERAAFHPFKDFDGWMNCFNMAIGRI